MCSVHSFIGFPSERSEICKNAHFVYTDQHKIAPLSQLLQRTMVLKLRARDAVLLPSSTLNSTTTPHKTTGNQDQLQTPRGGASGLNSSSLGENTKQDLETQMGQKIFLPKVQFLCSFRMEAQNIRNLIHSFVILLSMQWLLCPSPDPQYLRELKNSKSSLCFFQEKLGKTHQLYDGEIKVHIFILKCTIFHFNLSQIGMFYN